MNIEERRTIMNAFFNSQFSYCPLIWMFHSQLINNKINRLHERCLRIVYSDNQSTFEELLEKDNTVSAHQRNLKFLATELYKVLSGLSWDLMKDLFSLNDDFGYSTLNKRTFNSRHVKTVRHWFFGLLSGKDMGTGTKWNEKLRIINSI